MRNTKLIAAAVALAFSLSSMASDNTALGHDTTPMGGVRSGNSSGTIPAWTGGMSKPSGWSVGADRGEYSPFKNEKPLFSIDASNVDKYAEYLTPGQQLQIKQNKGYRMDVYPTHRTCAVPDFVAANTEKNLGQAKIASDGTSLETANLPGVPFPKPTSGIEAVWNFLTRYEGVGLDAPDMMTYISPHSGSSEPLIVAGPAKTYWPWAAKGTTTPSAVNEVYSATWSGTFTPAALAGQGFIQTLSFSKSPDSFFYFVGQRRVRRMPTYDHDAPLIGYENQYLADQVNVFNGNPDRYDWKIVGRKEIYVPYNAFAMYDANAKISHLMGANSVIPEARRYELHRVMEIEGTVKSGMRNTSAKRTLYLDEDSWMALVGDSYDSSGKIWKVAEEFPIPVWEIGACASTVLIQYDTATGRYLVDGRPVEGKELRWFQDGKGGQFDMSFYSPDALSARSER